MRQKITDILFYISLLPITIIAYVMMMLLAVEGAKTIWAIVGYIKNF